MSTQARSSERHLSAIEAGPPLWEDERFYFALCALNALVITGFWWHTLGALPIHRPADAINAIGRLTGLLGTYMVLWQLVLMARLPWIERAFGMERVIVVHRLNAYLSLGLILVHGVLQTIGYMLVDGLSFMGQLGDFVSGYQGMLAAIVGLLLMILVAGLSVAVARRRLSYQTWYFIHLYAYLAVAIAFSHEILLGADFINSPLFVAYWVVLYVLVAGALLGFRVGLPVYRLGHHGLRVERVVREAHGAVSIYIQGRHLEDLNYAGGQFMLWRFLDRQRWWEAHPYSLSLPPNRTHLRLTVRGLGDFSAALAGIRPGTPVMVEGPFGHFTAERCQSLKALLVAGGIGITPIRCLAEELAGRGVDVRVVYSCRRERDFALRDELERLESSLGVEVDFLVDEKRQRRQTDWFRAGNLRRLVPDVAERELYLCGPDGLTRELLRSADQLRIPGSRIHTEAFRF